MALADEAPPAPSVVDPFLLEAVNSRNRITVLRLEQEIERFARNPKQQDLLLKPMASSYERLAAHRVAQHYGLQSMVVGSLSPSTSRILLVKTSSECKLPSIRLMDIPLENATQEKSGLGAKFAIKKRENSASDAGSLHNSGEKGRFQMKTVEEREEEYDKARARIFSPNSDSSTPMDENNRVSNATSPKKEEENVSECSSDLQSFNIRSGEKSPSINSSRVAIFRDREKDMKDPDYNRNYKRYSQPLWMQTGMPGMMQTMRAMSGNSSEDYMRTSGPWGGPHTQFQGPWMGPSNQNVFNGSFVQNQLEVYLQRPNFTANIGHYGHTNDAFHYSFQPPGLQQMPRMSAMGR